MFTKYLCIKFIITIAFVKAIPIVRIERSAYYDPQGYVGDYNPNLQVQYDLNGNPIDVNVNNGGGAENEGGNGGHQEQEQEEEHRGGNEVPPPVPEESYGLLGGLFHKLGKKVKSAVDGGTKTVHSVFETGKSAVDAAKSKFGLGHLFGGK